MTKAIHSRFLKDENGAISDHLRSHVHLTNCIHLRNHMHRNSPILAERSLIRDLVVLQRSRSLRDPSTSPPSWHSTSVIDTLAKKLEKDGTIHCGRRSVGERRRDVRRLSDTSSPFGALATSKVAAAEVIRENDAVASVSGRSSVGRHRVTKRNKGEGSSKKNQRSDLSGEKTVQDKQDVGEGNDLVSRRVDQQDKKILQKRVHGHNVYVKTLSEQLRELPADSEDAECSWFHNHGRHAHEDKARREPEGFVRNYCNGLNRVKKRKVGGTRRSRLSVGSRDMGLHNEISVASNSLAQNSRRLSYYKEGEEGDAEFGVTQAPRNGCGIPWNWSRIHHRGKTFLDMAGRSLSCGLSDSRLRKTQGNIPENQRIVSDMPMGSDHSGSSQRSESEELPLLVEPSGSQESTENAIWTPRDYLGELGIFAKHNVKHGLDSDIASEVRSGGRRNYQRCRHGRHQSLTQKYMPRTFKDLVGQNLAVQALSNAVIRRKVGLLYVFHGPHGTGKTSCARIFARALNCQSIDHTKPCGTCSSCSAHELGKSRNVRELGGIGNFDFETLMDLVENMAASQLPSQYRVFIVDECDTLPLDSWSAISKVIDLAPRKVVFVLVSTTFDHFPHIIISRCQKFFFPKLKDADIIYALQWIATKESLDIDKDALKLIASRADGSLRDAEMTLDQLSLLAQRISVPLVQELVGLISDEKLVDLLDLALSADTVNTVKNLREIMEAGVEPLALMSQLATIITDILAGSYTFTREKLRRKFFRRSTLSKDDMERLRQALKTLSEAEKQLRLSNDRLTWLTAALLQLAPDQQYVLPSSSAETSFNSPAVTNNPSKKKTSTKWTSEQPGMYNNGDGLPTSIREENLKNESANFINSYMGGKRHVGVTPPRTSTDTRGSRGNIPGKGNKEIEEIWLAVIENIQINILKQLMLQEGKLMSLSLGAAPTAQLMFSSLVTKSKAEKFRGHILQAFECTLGSPVTIEIRCESSRKDQRGSDNGSAQFITNLESLAHDSFPKSGSENHMRNLLQDKTVKGATSTQAGRMHSDSPEISKNEIVEIGASKEHEGTDHIDGISQLEEKGMERVWVQEETSSRCQSISGSHPERRKIGEQSQRQSIVRSKVSLAHVIQQAEGRTQGSRWSRRKAVSIAEKLEQENLRLEPRSRNLLCWKASKVPRAKLPHLKNRTKGARSLLKLVSCSKCLCAKSPR